MSSNSLPKLAAAEMPIMQVIWDRGPIAVRAVVLAVNADRSSPVGRNTVLKQMQRLEEKGWLRRVSGDERPALYEATVAQEVAQRCMAQALKDALFGGSATALVRSLIGEGTLSEEEAKELRQLIRQARQR